MLTASSVARCVPVVARSAIFAFATLVGSGFPTTGSVGRHNRAPEPSAFPCKTKISTTPYILATVTTISGFTAQLQRGIYRLQLQWGIYQLQLQWGHQLLKKTMSVL